MVNPLHNAETQQENADRMKQARNAKPAMRYIGNDFELQDDGTVTTPSPTPQDDLEQQLSLAVFGKRTQELDLPVAERAYYVLPRLLRIISTREQKAHEDGHREGAEDDTSSAGSMRRANLAILDELKNIHLQNGAIVWIGGELNLAMPLQNRIAMFEDVVKKYPQYKKRLAELNAKREKP